jgi:5'-3' exonuclease
MIFLLGNDFLPHLVTLGDLDESIETMMRMYAMTGKSLTKDGDIDWPGLSSYLQAMSLEEPRLLELESIRDVKHPSRMMTLATQRTEIKGEKIDVNHRFDKDVFRSAWYENAFLPKGNRDVLAKLLPGYKFGSSNNKIVNMVKSYLVGIAWVYRYYAQGKNFVNNDYVYRYHYAPLLSDIAFVASKVGTTFQVEDYEFNPEAVEVNPVHQLLSVLPLKSKSLLPFEVEHLTKRDSPIADYFPASEAIERDGMNTDWQGILLINFVDMNRILEAVENTSVFSEERIREFSPTYNIVLKRDPTVSSLDERTRKFRDYLSKESKDNRGNKRYEPRQRQSYSGRGRGRGSQGNPNQSKGRGRGQSGRGRGFQGSQAQTKGRGVQVHKDIPPLPVFKGPKPLPVQRFEL